MFRISVFQDECEELYLKQDHPIPVSKHIKTSWETGPLENLLSRNNDNLDMSASNSLARAALSIATVSSSESRMLTFIGMEWFNRSGRLVQKNIRPFSSLMFKVNFQTIEINSQSFQVRRKSNTRPLVAWWAGMVLGACTASSLSRPFWRALASWLTWKQFLGKPQTYDKHVGW